MILIMYMKINFLILLICCASQWSCAQEFTIPELSPYGLSPEIQSPLYQSFAYNEFDLLVKNVNVFASPNTKSQFDFLSASASKQNRLSAVSFQNAVNRQMAQYGEFKVEINNSLNSIFMDYNDQPIYSGGHRVKNSVYQRADLLTGTPRRSPYSFAPSLSNRRNLGLRLY